MAGWVGFGGEGRDHGRVGGVWRGGERSWQSGWGLEGRGEIMAGWVWFGGEGTNHGRVGVVWREGTNHGRVGVVWRGGNKSWQGGCGLEGRERIMAGWVGFGGEGTNHGRVGGVWRGGDSRQFHCFIVFCFSAGWYSVLFQSLLQEGPPIHKAMSISTANLGIHSARADRTILNFFNFLF